MGREVQGRPALLLGGDCGAGGLEGRVVLGRVAAGGARGLRRVLLVGGGRGGARGVGGGAAGWPGLDEGVEHGAVAEARGVVDGAPPFAVHAQGVGPVL